MKQVVVSIFDRLAEVYSRPVFVATEALAVRSFSDEVNNAEGGDLGKHPGDYDLYVLGSFDDNTGRFGMEDYPRLLIKGVSAVNPVKE